MDSLRVKHSVAQVRQAIQDLPKGIEKAYDKAIDRIRQQNEDDRTLAFAVLSWITFACRPLSVLELRFAVAMAPDATELDSDDAVMETCLTLYCAGLVVIDETTKIVHLVRMLYAAIGEALMLTLCLLQTIQPNNISKTNGTFYSRMRKLTSRRRASRICRLMAFTAQVAIPRHFFAPWINALFSITLLGTGAIMHEDRRKLQTQPLF